MNTKIEEFERKIDNLSEQKEIVQISIVLNKLWIQGNSGIICIDEREIWKSINDLVEKKKIDYDAEIKKLCNEVSTFEKETGLEIF